jgi:hypothetical protein
MNGILTFVALVVCVGILLMVPSPASGAMAMLLCVALASVVAFLISTTTSDRKFLLRMFVSALLIRMVVGTLIFVFGLQGFFGGDAFTYDSFGYGLFLTWQGDNSSRHVLEAFIGTAGGSGWGMLYLVAIVYQIVGRNMLAVQFLNAVLGAATAPVIFLCAQHIFANSRVARVSSLLVAFYPSLILWSSQGLKDGPIVFLLAVSMLATLRLGEKFSIKYLAVLVAALLGVLSIRFYIFYMLVAAIGGAFTIGMRAVTAERFARQFASMIIVGLAFTYFGISRYASTQLAVYGSLEQLQISRRDATSAVSGFERDADVSSASGVLSALPSGMIYLLFAPFPWQLSSLRQTITLPEMLVWWASFPLLVLGLWFTTKYRLRQVSPILIFSTMLTLAYSVFQGNVGNAYRQRAQLLVFYFILVAVGLVLVKEKKENMLRREEPD